jgi:CubicO group peptidase (beta-lactamase class C family)
MRPTLPIAALVLAGSLWACGGGGAVPSPHPLPSPTGSAIDKIVEGAYPENRGVELAIFKNSALLYERGYGLRDRGLPELFYGQDFWNIEQPDTLFNLTRGRLAPDANTSFDLASVSKEFTAGAILLLQQDGKLSVNDPLSKYFPSFPNGDAITLMDLLHHQSGLVEYNNFGVYPDFSGAYAQFMTDGQTNYQPIVDALATFPLKFAPGSQFDYSNSNYVLLGMIVAQVSGEPLGDFLRQRIFGPLGMTHSAQSYPPPPVSDLALGYASVGGAFYRSWQWNLKWLAGPGGLTSTVVDIEKWDEAVRKPGIFTQQTLTQMFTPGSYPQSYGTYADGWFIATLQGHAYVWHDGAVGGFGTMNATFPNDGLDIVILTNDGTGLDPYYIVPQLLPLALALPALESGSSTTSRQISSRRR